MKKVKDFLNKAQDKTVELLNHPHTQSVSKMGAQFLQVAAHIGQANIKGPLSIVSAGVGLINVLSNREQLSMDDILLSHGLEKYSFTIPTALKFLIQKDFLDDAKVLATQGTDSAFIKETPYGPIVVVLNKTTRDLSSWYGMWTYPNKVPPLEYFSTCLWEKYGNYITLGYEANPRGSMVLGLKEFVPYTNHVYLSEHSPIKIVEHFNAHKEFNLGRSFVLIGPPGTGKTTFCFHLSKLLGGKMILIDPSFFNFNVDINELISILKSCNPSIVLFDDIDSNQNIKQKFLTLFDMMRNSLPQTIIVSTCNNFYLLPEALRRPGRLGRRFYFLAPKKAMRLDIVNKYRELYGVKRDLSYLADIMDHPNFSPDYIKAMVEQSLVDSDDELKKYVKELLKDWPKAKIEEDLIRITDKPLEIEDDLDYEDNDNLDDFPE